MPQLWPDSHLTSLENGFQAVVRAPISLALDCRHFDDLPQRMVRLDRLRHMLVNPATMVSRHTRDDVWRELVIRFRGGERGWRVAAAGMAVPGLKAAAARLAPGWCGEVSDLDGELVVGFLERMATISLDADRICGKLIDAAQRAVRRSRHWSLNAARVRVEGARSVPPPAPWGHPDFVLLRALAAGYLDQDEFILISETRLEDMPLPVVAERLGIGTGTAAQWRRTAEQTLRRAISAGDLDWDSVLGAGAAQRRRAAARSCAAASARTGVFQR